jgi:uncharacterized protein
MQKVKLPKQVDPIKSANKCSEYRGIMLTRDMPRLLEAVEAVVDEVEVEVSFNKDEQGLSYFNGHLSSSATLLCQRCNNVFTHQIDVSFCFSPVQGTDNEDTDELPDAYEPAEVNDQGEVNLLQTFEDELILSLPIVALHAEEDCDVKADEMSFGVIEPANERPNPFAVLKELKRD